MPASSRAHWTLSHPGAIECCHTRVLFSRGLSHLPGHLQGGEGCPGRVGPGLSEQGIVLAPGHCTLDQRAASHACPSVGKQSEAVGRGAAPAGSGFWVELGGCVRNRRGLTSQFQCDFLTTLLGLLYALEPHTCLSLRPYHEGGLEGQTLLPCRAGAHILVDCPSQCQEPRELLAGTETSPRVAHGAWQSCVL